MSLNIDTLSQGQKVKYLDINGTDYQRSTYEDLGINTNDTYTIKRWHIDNWFTAIYLEEFGYQMFNSVCFVEAN